MDEKTRAALIEYAQASEESAAKLKRAMANLSLASNTGKPNNEAIFMNLSFEKRTSDRLGEYEVASKTSNNTSAWSNAINILKESNATISSRYYGEDHAYSYWLFGEDANRIYRQKLKPHDSNLQGE